MEQYIKKSDLVAEIKERIETYNKGYANGDDKRADALEVLLHDIANFEVKEVDLNKELSYEDYKGFFEKYPDLSDDWGFNEAWMFANYFFKLGMAVSNKQIEEKKNIDSLEEKCNTIYKDITMIGKDGNTINAKIEQREKV